MRPPRCITFAVCLTVPLVLRAQCTSQQNAVTSLQHQVQTDENAIRRVAPAMQTASLQDWAAASEEQKRHILTESLGDAAKTMVGEALQRGSDYAALKALKPTVIEGVRLPNGIGSIGAAQKNAILTRMEQKGFGDTLQGNGMMEVIRELGATSNKNYKIQILAQVPSRLLDVEDLVGSKNGLEVASAAFQMTASLAGKGDFAVTLGNALFKGGENLFDAYVISKSITSLGSSTESTLKAINALNVPLKNHVAQLQQARAHLSTCQTASIKQTADNPKSFDTKTNYIDFSSQWKQLVDRDKALSEAEGRCMSTDSSCRSTCQDPGWFGCIRTCDAVMDACFNPLQKQREDGSRAMSDLNAAENKYRQQAH